MSDAEYWLVKVHADLEQLPVTARTSPTTRFGVWEGVHNVNGIAEVTAICAISSETLDFLLRDSGCKRVFDAPGAWHWEHGPECLTPRAAARNGRKP